MNFTQTQRFFGFWRVLSLFFMAAILFFPLPSFTLAQEGVNTNTSNSTLEQPAAETIPLAAEAGEDQNAVVGRSILFNASATTGPKDQIDYKWDFGDGTNASGLDTTHAYARPGVFRVTLTAKTGEQTSKDTLIVSVAGHLVVLVTDQSVKQSEVKKIYDYGLTQDVLIVNVRDESKDSNFIVTKNLVEKLLLSQNDLKQAQVVIVMTSGTVGLNALSELAQAFENQQGTKLDLNWKQKTIVMITESRSSVARIAQSTQKLVNPEHIILTKDEGLFPVVSAGTAKNVLTNLQTAGVDYQIINQYSQRALEKLNPLNIMSYAIYYLTNRGLDQSTILLILSLPMIATIIVIARQLVGIKAFGIYVPSMIALTFIAMSLKFGLIIFFTLLITGTLTRIVAKRMRLLYLPRMAIVLTVVSLSIFAIFITAAAFDKKGFLTVSIFPILIMTILTERFVEAQIEKGIRTAIKLTIESLILSIIGYYIVTWEVLENIILAYPEVVILLIFINIIVGRFAGLRLTEYLRFFNLFKHERTPETKDHPRNE